MNVILTFEEYQQIRTALSRAEGALGGIRSAIDVGRTDQLSVSGMREQEILVGDALTTLNRARTRSDR